MSTNERYFGLVCAAINEFDKEAVLFGSSYWFVASVIAERAGVSVPTTRKYLARLVDDGHVFKSGTKRMPIYAVVKEA